jgi:hypothetical protein
MKDAKPWQIVLVIVAAIALVVSVSYQILSSDEVTSSDTLTFVDVKSGELFRSPKPKDRAIIIPATNPLTKADTLVPAYEDKGNWFVVDRYIEFARKNVSQGADSILVDRKSSQIKPKSGTVAEVNLFEDKK